MLVVVRRVERIRTRQLAQHVHRARGDPVRAERDVHADEVEHRHVGGVSVEVDVRPRRPHHLGHVHPDDVGVDRIERDAVDDRRLRLDEIRRRCARADELVASLDVDAFGDVREIAVQLGHGGVRGAARRVVASRREVLSRRAEREDVGVGGVGRQSLELVGRGVDVAHEPGNAAATGHRRRTGDEEAQLAVGLHRLVRAALVVEAHVAAPALPVAPVLVPEPRVRDRRVVLVGDVLVRVDEARRDHPVRARDDRRGRVGGVGAAVTACTEDDSRVVDEDLAAMEDLVGREHGPLVDPADGAGLRHSARARSGRRERGARALGDLRLRVLARMRLRGQRRHDGPALTTTTAVTPVRARAGGRTTRVTVVAACDGNEGQRQERGAHERREELHEWLSA